MKATDADFESALSSRPKTTAKRFSRDFQVIESSNYLNFNSKLYFYE